MSGFDVSGFNVRGALSQAVALHQAGRLDEASQLYNVVLKHDRRNADAHNLLGLIAQSRGQLSGALEHFERALKASPKMPSAHFNKGNALSALNRTTDAAKAYRAAIAVQAGYADARLNLGAMLHKSGNLDQAITVFREMTVALPADARGHYNLARCLAEANDAANAEASLRQALTIDPAYADARITLAKLFADTRDFSKAIAEILPVLNLPVLSAQASALAWTNYGAYLSASDDQEKAITAFNKALEVDPGYNDARANRGMARLVMADFRGGWEDYAYRPVGDVQLPWPVWTGQPLEQKKLLLWADQGLGDQILYASMVAEIARRAGSCVFACSGRLNTLMRRSMPHVQIVPFDQLASMAQNQHFDFHTPVTNLGRWCRTSPSAFPNRKGYLSAGPAQRAVFREKYDNLFGHQTLKVGFSWRSFAPHIGAAKNTDVSTWRPLLSAKGVALISLQYGAADAVNEDVLRFQEQSGTSIYVDRDVDPGGDMDAQAAQISALDLVVTVSNTTAHLAGALGVPVMLIVPTGHARLWYWFKQGGYSPWYAEHHLVRMDGPQDDVATKFGRVLAAVQRLISA